MSENKGRLELVSIPNKIAEEKIIAYLVRISKNKSEQQIIKMLSRTPVVLAGNISEKKGRALAVELSNLGAWVKFIPSGPPAPQDEERVLPDKTGRSQNAGKPAPLFRYRTKGLLVTLGLVLCAVFAIYGIFNRQEKGGKKEKSNIAAAPAVQQKAKAKIPASLLSPLDALDFSKAPSYDKRLAIGLKKAFRLYLGLISKEESTTRVKLSASRLEKHRYRITYTLKSSKSPQKYDLVLSTKGSDIIQNMNALEQAVGSFKRNNGAATSPSSNIFTAQSFDRVRKLISRFDYEDMISALQFVENRIGSGDEGPASLLAACEVYSWLAFFKNSNANRKLSDFLSELAVASYLVGKSFCNENTDTSYYQGLLLLSLDYPAASAKTLDPAHPAGGLLSAYIKYDFKALRELSDKPTTNRRLAGYLEGRSLLYSRQDNIAYNKYRRLMHDFPDFLPAKELVADTGSVSLARQHTEAYLIDLLEKHLHIFRRFMDVSWIGQDNQLAMAARQEASGGNRIKKWLKIHNTLTTQSKAMKQGEHVINAGILCRIMREDLENALLIYYDLEANLLGRLPEAAAIADTIESVYPGSQIQKVVKLKLLTDYKDASTLFNYADAIKVNTADRYLLSTMLKSYNRWVLNDKRFPRIVELLNAFKRKESPNAEGLYGLYSQFFRFHYQPYAIDFLKGAIAIDPYTCTYYAQLLRFEDSEEYIRNGESRIRHLYGFLTAVAAWHKRQGRTEKAIEYYEKAIGNSPGQKTAYYLLGKIFEKNGQYEKAIDVWKKYLEHDRWSLSAVANKNAIGRAYLKTKDYEKAYEIFRESKQSGQNGALIGFAEASEKTGRTLQSEKYYQKAARRYPSSKRSAVNLALFYLRQNNRKTACEVLRTYKRYNHFSYYFDKLIDFFAGQGDPAEAIQVVKEVENGNPSIWVVQNLGDHFGKKGHFEIVRSLFEPFMKNLERPKEGFPHIFAAGYLDFCLQDKQCDGDSVLTDILSRYIRIPPLLEQLGINLLAKGHYDAAFKAFQAKYESTDRRKDIAFVMMALAWRLGSKDASAKEEMIALLAGFSQNKWLAARIRFLLGEFDEKAIIGLANSSDKRCEIFYYLGAIRKSEVKLEEARKYLLLCLETEAYNNIEYHYALEMLKKMES